MKASTRLRQLMATGQSLVAPGIYDGLTGRLVERAGFAAAYASGGAIARSTGIPDLGLIDPGAIVRRLEEIVEVIDIPVIADADTGYGNALNARRAARGFERAGVAGFHLEDQVFPKRCGHYDDKSLVPTHEFTQKMKAMRDAMSDDDMVIIARTDAIAVEGFDAAIERAQAYAEAGADVVFVEAPTSLEQIEAIAARIPQPKLINMFHGGKTPLVPLERLQALGYAIVIIPSDLQRAAIHAMEATLDAIRKDGNSGALEASMTSFQAREQIVETARFLELDKRFGA